MSLKWLNKLLPFCAFFLLHMITVMSMAASTVGGRMYGETTPEQSSSKFVQTMNDVTTVTYRKTVMRYPPQHLQQVPKEMVLDQ